MLKMVTILEIDGVGIMFWMDRWLLDEPLALKFPALFELKRSQQMVCIGWGSGQQIGIGNEWKRAINNGVESMELQQLTNLLCAPILSDMRDRWVRLLDESGNFSVRSLKKGLQCLRYSRTTYVRNGIIRCRKKRGIWHGEQS